VIGAMKLSKISELLSSGVQCGFLGIGAYAMFLHNRGNQKIRFMKNPISFFFGGGPKDY